MPVLTLPRVQLPVPEVRTQRWLQPSLCLPRSHVCPLLQSCSQPLWHHPESLHALILCQMQDLETVHLKFPKVSLLTHFCSLSRSLWMVALPSRVSTGHPNLVSPTNLNTVQDRSQDIPPASGLQVQDVLQSPSECDHKPTFLHIELSSHQNHNVLMWTKEYCGSKALLKSIT